MGYRPGQPIQLEGDRRALRKAVQSAAIALACTSVFFALGALFRHAKALSWATVDWLQVSALAGSSLLATVIAIRLGWRGLRTVPVVIVWLACVVVAIISGQLLFKALVSPRALVIDYSLYLFAVGWVCLVMGGYFIFRTRRS